jgi:hypothetical protein
MEKSEADQEEHGVLPPLVAQMPRQTSEADHSASQISEADHSGREAEKRGRPFRQGSETDHSDDDRSDGESGELGSDDGWDAHDSNSDPDSDDENSAGSSGGQQWATGLMVDSNGLMVDSNGLMVDSNGRLFFASTQGLKRWFKLKSSLSFLQLPVQTGHARAFFLLASTWSLAPRRAAGCICLLF